MATIRSGGIMSGLDTNAIIDAMVAAERTPITKMTSQKNAYTTQLSKLGKIKAALQTLNDAAKGLDTQGEVLAYKATSGDAAQVRATASSAATAVAGSYSVKVTELARPEINRSAAIASDTGPVRAGSVSIGVAGEPAVTVAFGESATLHDVVNAINASRAKVSATLVTDGTNYFVQLTARETGFTIGGTADDALTITESYSGTTGSTLSFTQSQQATNAKFEVDGLSVESRSNSLSTAIPGVTLEAVSKGTSATTVGVAVDADTVVANVKKYVDAYNNLQALIQAELSVNDKTARASSLAGDPMMRELKNSVANVLNGAAGNSGLANMSSVGVTSGRDGQLTFNDSKLRTLLASSPSDVVNLFTDATNGVAKKMQALAAGYLNTVSGRFHNREVGLQSSMTGLDKSIATLETRIAKYQETLINKFTAMETAISQLRSQGNALSTAFGARS